MLGLVGHVEEAKLVAQRLLELEPAFRVGAFVAFAHFVDAQLRDAVAVGIRRAGLPE
jgi:hypothetical protein